MKPIVPFKKKVLLETESKIFIPEHNPTYSIYEKKEGNLFFLLVMKLLLIINAVKF